MAKRFIDTNLFKTARMKRLPPHLKLFYVYLICEADHTGTWRVELDVAALRIGMELPVEAELLAQLDGFAVPFDGGTKWWLPDFVAFQYGELNPANRVHRAVIENMEKYQLTENEPQSESPKLDPSKPLASPYVDPSKGQASPKLGAKDKDKEKDKDKDKEKDKAPAKKKPAGPFADFMKAYADFLADRSLPTRITDADGAALKAIVTYFEQVDTVKAGSKTALELWQFMLDNWHLLTDWQRGQVQLRQINSQLPNMIETLRTNYGKPKPTTGGTGSAAHLAATIRESLAGNT